MAVRDKTSVTGSGSNTLLLPVPTVQISDIVVIGTGFDQSGSTITWPANFVEFAQGDLTGDGQRYGFAYKRLTAVDSGNYTITKGGVVGSDWCAGAVSFSGRHLTTAPVASTVATNNAANASPVTVTANGVTAVDNDDLIWWSVPDVRATGVGNGHTPPSGYTEQIDIELAWANLSAATKENVAAGATGSVAGTFALTGNSSGWAAVLIRIPAARALPPFHRSQRFMRRASGLFLPLAGVALGTAKMLAHLKRAG